MVGQDGTVVQCVNESDTAWGNGRVEAGADSCEQKLNITLKPRLDLLTRYFAFRVGNAEPESGHYFYRACQVQ